MATQKEGGGASPHDGIERVPLTRKEAGAYVGLSDSGIRDAEARGLPNRVDSFGQHWFDPDDLDAWPWRSKQPSAAKKKTVLAQAAKARAHERRLREHEEEKRRVAEDEAHAAHYSRFAANMREQNRLSDEVVARNDAAKAKFTAENVSLSEVVGALGRSSWEGRATQRDLRVALIAEVEPPKRLEVQVELDGSARIAPGWQKLVNNGPFYLRSAVLQWIDATAARHQGGGGPANGPASAPDDVGDGDFLLRALNAYFGRGK